MFHITFAEGVIFVGLLTSVVGSISNSTKWRTDVSKVNTHFIYNVLIWFGGSLIATPGIIISSLFILNPWYKIIVIILIVIIYDWYFGDENAVMTAWINGHCRVYNWRDGVQVFVFCPGV